MLRSATVQNSEKPNQTSILVVETSAFVCIQGLFITIYSIGSGIFKDLYLVNSGLISVVETHCGYESLPNKGGKNSGTVIACMLCLTKHIRAHVNSKIEV